MSDKSKVHTPLRLPLRCDTDDLGYSGTFGVYADIRDDDGYRIALILRGTPDGKDLPFRENAAEILTAVNSHAALLEMVAKFKAGAEAFVGYQEAMADGDDIEAMLAYALAADLLTAALKTEGEMG